MAVTKTTFEYIRRVDVDRLGALPKTERFSQKMLEPASGARACTATYIRTPKGGGSPEGMHVHDVDQLMFIIEGAMSVEVDGRRDVVGPGTLVVIPAGIAHRNWNDGDAPTVHLAVNAPVPDPDKPRARRV